MNRGKAGISPVMATVILVAIAIVIAIAVAFWATGLVGVFTRFEKIEIVAAYATNATDVTLQVKNTGSSPTTIDNIFVNGIPCNSSSICQSVSPSPPISLPTGSSQTLTIKIAGGYSGTTLEIAVHTASGKTYPAAVLIP
ncbi:MAG: hypothetical protein DRN47_00980 [Candidatus Wolframiiraptor sp.]|nr:MAG: hypothetical protein DRN47_00980 [Candidatus Wolframiiraptor sp.]